MELLFVGLNHQTAPVQVRDRVAIVPAKLPAALRQAGGWPGLLEVVLLSTCNRSEVWAVAENADLGSTAIHAFLFDYHDVPLEALEPHLYCHVGAAAVRHGFRVIAGLDSMVLGEPQIAGQVKEAFAAARSARTSGFLLERLHQHALKTHKRIRHETRLGEGAVSVSYVAVELARKIFGDLEQRRVLVLGAGEMSELTLQCLAGAGVRAVQVSNRTHAHAEALARRHAGQVVAWEAFADALSRTDIVISSTGASHPVVRLPMVRAAMARRRNEALFLIDIAAPRDIEPEVGDLYNVFLYNIDDLNAIAQENRRQRQSEAAAAARIVDDETETFMRWLASLDVKGIIVALSGAFDAARCLELQWLRPKLGEIAERDWDHVVQFSRRLMNKLLHQPLRALRESSAEDDSAALADAARQLFDLTAEPPRDTQTRSEENGGDSD